MSETRPDPNPAPKSIPSTSIIHGADLLIALIEDEKTRLEGIYEDYATRLENRGREAQADADAKLLRARNELEKQQARIDGLTEGMRRATAAAHQAEEQNRALAREHAELKASLERVGLVYADGAFRFSDSTARIVDDFVTGARVQSERLANAHMPVSQGADALLFNTVGPAEFWDVLASVLDKGRQLAAPNSPINNKSQSSTMTANGHQ